MAAPVIEWVRPGVGFTPAAAASFRRMEADAGRRIDVNSSYRDYEKQLAMWRAWTLWTQGKGPKPNHGRAIHPDQSMHCKGLAVDTDDVSLLLALADHGWRRTAADEAWHFEYQVWNDQHRNRPAGGDSKPLPTPEPALPEEEDDDMYKPTVHVRTEGAFEATLAHPEIGQSLAQYTGPGTGGKTVSADKKVTTFRGFMVTADEAVAAAWARTHAKGVGGETSRTNRTGYIQIQVEASRIAAAITS